MNSLPDESKRSQNLKHTLSRNRRSPAFVRLGCSAILSRCHRRRIAQWMSGNSKRSAIKPEKPAIRVARKHGQICEAGCNREIPNWFYRVASSFTDPWPRIPEEKTAAPKTIGRLVQSEDIASTRCFRQRRQWRAF